MFQHFAILFFLVHFVQSNLNSNCGKEEMTVSYLDLASQMIEKAKSSIPTCTYMERDFPLIPVDCADVLRMGKRRSGVYTIWPMSRLTEDRCIDVYCDMDTDGGGWTIIQRRGNFGKPTDFFNKPWFYYNEGFGDIKEDFWLGNNNIFALTNQKLYSARFDLQDVKLKRAYALYGNFWIEDLSNQYTLRISEFLGGDAGDSMVSHHSNQKFSTKDVENDNHKDLNCAVAYKGGWWYNACHRSNLNGLYLRGVHENSGEGVNWFTWRGQNESLESTEIKIRPKKFVGNCLITTPE